MHAAHERRTLRADGKDWRMQRRETPGNPAARGNAQERVQRGTILGRVDRLAREECVDPAEQSAGFRKRSQCAEGGRIEALPAEIKKQAAGLAREMSEAARILGK